MKLQIKMKILIATAIAILLVATACSGGDDLSVTTNQVGFPAGPTTTTESDGSSNLVEVSSEPAPVTTESIATTAPSKSETIDSPPPPEKGFSYDTSGLEPHTNFKNINGERHIYIKEVDDYLPCWEAMTEAGIINEKGYCVYRSNKRFFVDNDGVVWHGGYRITNLLAAREEQIKLQDQSQHHSDGIGITLPWYDIPDSLPLSARVFNVFLGHEGARDHGASFIKIACKDIGKYRPTFDDVYTTEIEIARHKTWWIHEDGLCKNGFGYYIEKGNGLDLNGEPFFSISSETLHKGKIVKLCTLHPAIDCDS